MILIPRELEVKGADSTPFNNSACLQCIWIAFLHCKHSKILKSCKIVHCKIPPRGLQIINAKDVCDALGIALPHRALSGLEDDEKGRHTVNTLGGKQEMTVVTEPGLYSLVMRSRKK